MSRRTVRGGRTIYGQSVGVLCLDTAFPRLPGDMGNASTFEFPVRYLRIDGASRDRVLARDPQLLPPFLEGARALETEGVRSISTTCGFLAMFQPQLAAGVTIPVFTSSLLLVPLVRRMLAPGRVVGILTADAGALGEPHFNATGWSASEIPVAIQGLEGSAVFLNAIGGGPHEDVDVEEVARSMEHATRSLLEGCADVGAIVLECANMAPYAHVVQRVSGLPVFDIQGLTNLVHEATHRAPYEGFM